MSHDWEHGWKRKDRTYVHTRADSPEPEDWDRDDEDWIYNYIDEHGINYRHNMTKGSYWYNREFANQGRCWRGGDNQEPEYDEHVADPQRLYKSIEIQTKQYRDKVRAIGSNSKRHVDQYDHPMSMAKGYDNSYRDRCFEWADNNINVSSNYGSDTVTAPVANLKTNKSGRYSKQGEYSQANRSYDGYPKKGEFWQDKDNGKPPPPQKPSPIQQQ